VLAVLPAGCEGGEGVSAHIARVLREQGIDYRTFDRTLVDLKDRGLSHPAIAAVVEYYEGWPLTEHQVRGRLEKVGYPKNPLKVRAGQR
jgi:hypothetical protein